MSFIRVTQGVLRSTIDDLNRQIEHLESECCDDNYVPYLYHIDIVAWCVGYKYYCTCTPIVQRIVCYYLELLLCISIHYNLPSHTPLTNYDGHFVVSQ